MLTVKKKWMIAASVLTALAMFGAGFLTGWICRAPKRRKPAAKAQETAVIAKMPERDESGQRVYYTGERGGRYYIKDGKRVYVRKRKKKKRAGDEPQE